jgi:hypothetical protein
MALAPYSAPIASSPVAWIATAPIQSQAFSAVTVNFDTSQSLSVTPSIAPLPSPTPTTTSSVVPTAAPTVYHSFSSVTIDIHESQARRRRQTKEQELKRDRTYIRRRLDDHSTNTTTWGNDTDTLDVMLSYSLGDGVQITKTASVVVSYENDTATHTSHVFFFENLPTNELVTALAHGRHGDLATTAFWAGQDQQVYMALESIPDPSSVLNLDFSSGTADGWTLRGAADQITIVPHVEEVTVVDSAKNVFERDSEIGGGDESDAQRQLQENPVIPSSTMYDLVLSTGTVPGEVSVSYAFEVAESSAIVVRYRIVNEMSLHEPIDSMNNDYFQLSIRSSGSRLYSSESWSVLGLGGKALDVTSGSTGWRTVTLLDASGVVAVDVILGKVGDSPYSSQMVIDFVETRSASG